MLPDRSGAFLIQVTTHGGIRVGALGSSKLFVTSLMISARNWKSCRSSHVSTTWWQTTSSPGLKTHASVRRSRFPVLSLCWPKSFILTDNYMTSKFLHGLSLLSFLFKSCLFFKYVGSTHFFITVKFFTKHILTRKWPQGQKIQGWSRHS